MKKILIVFGTRPEAIKMAPLVHEFDKFPEQFITKVCVTAQHRQMLDQVVQFFGIVPSFDLNVMKTRQDLYSLSSDILVKMKEILETFKPNYVFVHGDTTTSFITSLASFYFGAKVCHVEAGLRTNNKYAPFPEELNRSMTARLADYHFAPTINAKNNLLKENIPIESILVTGNTVIDALLWGLGKIKNDGNLLVEELSKQIRFDKPIILVTAHRRENFGEGFINICLALKKIAESGKATIVYPVHLNPNVQNPVNSILINSKNIFLINPLPYSSFIWLMSRSSIIITDSGGVQEEAPSLGKPVLVLRDVTERPEAVEAGTVILVGTNKERIVSNTLALLDSEELYFKMSTRHNPYGDGKSCKRIVEFIKNL